MSYDIDLIDPVTKDVIDLGFKHQMTGGTYAVGGTTDASLNITYNYSDHFCRVIDEEQGIRFIYGLSGAESITVLESAISELSDDVDDNYWKSTEGNAKQALVQLLALAKLRPDGEWHGD